MAKPAKAIILSAGQGKRLSPLTDTRPKCLVELSGRTVLHWQLKHLAEAGITEVVVVTGFAADTVETEIAGLKIPGLSVRTLFNPFYALTDNLATCWLARGELVGDVLLLNGDTLFETAIAERLIAAPPAPITVTIDRKASGYDADDMKVLTEGLKRWYLSVINQIAQDHGEGGHDVVSTQSIEGLQWAEMDFPEDLPGNRALAAAWVAAGE